MNNENNGLEQAGGSLDDPVVVQVPATSNSGSGFGHSKISPFQFNRTAFLMTSVALLSVGFLVSTAVYFLTAAHSGNKANSTGKAADKYSVSSLSTSDIKNNAKLQVGQVDKLSVNGQLQVSDTVVLAPTSAPAVPKAGQIYYDKTTQAPYFFNGSNFISLSPQHVSSLGGSTGSITVGDGLTINQNQISVSSSLLQSVASLSSSQRVTTLQGMSGDINLSSGAGVGISGTTITNLGVLSLTGTAGQVNVSGSTGNITLSLPQNIDSSASPTFQSLRVNSSLVFSDGSGHTTTIQGNALGQDQTIFIPDSGAASDIVCLKNLSNCQPAGGAVVSNGATLNHLARFTDANGSQLGNSLLYDNGVSVGVGTNSPGSGYKLDVSGNANVSGNTSIGANLNVSGTVAFTNIGAGVVKVDNSGNLSGGSITLGTDTTGSYVASLGTLTGLTVTGNSGPGSTPALTVAYGSTTGTAVQGNTTLTCTSGTGNLSGGGGVITLGSGGSCGSLSITNSPTFSGNLVVQGANGVKVGQAGSTDGVVTFASSANNFLGSLKINSLGQNTTYFLPDSHQASDTICLHDLGNCDGSGNGVTTTGGTSGKLAVFTGPNSLGDSSISDNGSMVTVSGDLTVNAITANSIQSAGTFSITSGGDLNIGTSSQVLALQGNGSSSLTISNNGFTSVISFMPAGGLSGNQTIKFPDASGTVCLQNANCGFASAGSGVTSVIGSAVGSVTATGALTINNAKTTASAITIDDATTSAKGIASFNSTNFSVASGVVNTIQSIATTSSVTFGSLSLGTGDLTLAAGKNVKTDNIKTSNAASDLTLDAGAKGIVFKTNSGDSFQFPTGGGSGQTICTTGVTCASGGGQAVILEPGGGVQTASSDNTAIFINKASGAGNLIQLQAGGVDTFVINSTGVITAANLTVNGTLKTNTITPTAALTIGSTSQAFTMQGSSASLVTGVDSGFSTSLGFGRKAGNGAPTGSVTYQLQNDSSVAPGTYFICTTVGNCSGTGSSVTTSGGTAGVIAKFTASGNIADSILSESSNTISVGGNLSIGVSGASQLSIGVGSTQNGSLVFKNSTNNNKLTIDQVSTAPTGDINIKLPNASGVFAVSASGALHLDPVTGELTCASCLTSGGGAGGGVSSIKGGTSGSGINGDLTLQNATSSGTNLTIDNASATAKGIASFNSTNFSVTSGAVNTAQDIATSSSPTFQNLAIQGSTGLTLGTASNLGQLIFKDGTADGFTSTFRPTTLTNNRVITIPDAGGTLAVSASGNLSLSAAGALTITSSPTFSTSVTTPSVVGSTSLSVGSLTQALTLQGNGSTVIKSKTGSFTTSVGFAASTADRSITLPDASGEVCLAAPVNNCNFSAGGGGVSSLNGDSGAVLLNNSSATDATHITIDNADYSSKGIASFSSSNFTVTNGAVNTVQDIATTATPTFAGLTVSGLGSGILQSTSGVVTSSTISRNSSLLSGTLTVANGGTGLTSFTSNGILYGSGSGISVTTTANNSILATNGSGTPALTQTLPSAVQGNITGTGTLTGGNIAAGFGSIVIGSMIWTDNSLYGGTFSAGSTGQFAIDGSGNASTSGSLTLGTSSTTAGSIVFYNASNGHKTTLKTIAAALQDQTITIPASSATTDTVCLVTLANCTSGSGGVSNFINNQTTQQSSANFNIKAKSGGTIAAVIQGDVSQDIANFLDSGGSTVAKITSTGAINAVGATFSGSVSVSGSNTLGVGGLTTLSGGLTVTGATNINTTGSAALTVGNSSGGAISLQSSSAITLNSNGGIILNGTPSNTYTTPGGSTVAARVMLPTATVGAFGQLLTLGLSSSSDLTARGISVFDARTSGHQASIGVFSPDESSILGFSWNGSNTTGYVDVSGNKNLTLRTNSTDVLTAQGDGNVGIGGSASYKLDVAGDIRGINGTNSATALQIQNSAGANVLQVSTVADSANLLTNGSFEANTTGWQPVFAAGSSNINRTTTQQYTGGASLQVVTGGTATASGTNYSITLTNSTTYSLSFYAKGSTAFTDLIAGYASTGLVAGQTNCALNSTSVTTNSWTRYTCTFTTAASHSGTPYIYISQSGTTGHTFYVDGIKLEQAASSTAYKEGSIALNGAVNSPSLFQNTTDSTNAFQIQNSAGVSLLTADTANSRISIGTTVAATGQLYISGQTPSAAIGSANGTATAYGLAVQGKYAYTTQMTFSTTNGLQIYDVSNPASPTLVKTTGTLATGIKVIKIQGKYAYIAGYNGNTSTGTLEVFDISNPLSPTSVGSQNFTSSSNNFALYVQGRYAYVGESSTNALYVFDVSNPASIPAATTVSSVGTSGVGPYSIYAQGRYIYLANNTSSNAFQVVDTNTWTVVKTIANTSLGSGTLISVTAQGRYAYVGLSNGSIYTIDISDPTSATVVGSSLVTGGSSARGLVTQGRYMYVGDTSAIRTVDISNPAAPVNVSGTSSAQSPLNLVVSGRYLYTSNNSGTNTLQVFDLGGTYSQQLEAGGIETDSLSVRGAASFVSDVSIQGSLGVGAGLQVTGKGLAVQSSSTSAFQVSANSSATALLKADTTNSNVTVASAATTGTAMNVTANSLTTGSGLVVSTTAAPTSGSLVMINNAGSASYTSTGTYTNGLLNVARTNTVATPAVTPTLDSSATNTTASASSYTISQTVANNTNRILLVAANGWVSSVTWTVGGTTQTLSLLSSSVPPGFFNGGYLYYILAPTVGAGTVTVNQSFGAASNASSSSWYNVVQSAPTVATASNTSTGTSVSVASSASDVVVDTMYNSSVSATVGGSQTVLHNNSTNAGIHTSYKTGSAGSTSMTWSNSGSTAWSAIAADLAPANLPASFTGAVASFSNNCSVTSGSCADSSSVLSLNQQYANATGAVLQIQNASSAADILLGSGKVDMGAAGTISIGATTATAVSLGRSGATTTVNGPLTVANSSLTSLSGGLNVTGAAALSSTLTVASTINSQTISSAANFTGTLTTAGLITANSTATASSSSAGGLIVNANSLQTSATNTAALSVNANALTSGSALAVVTTSSSLISGSLVNINQTSSLTSVTPATNTLLNVSRAITANPGNGTSVTYASSVEGTTGWTQPVSANPNQVLVVFVGSGGGIGAACTVSYSLGSSTSSAWINAGNGYYILPNPNTGTTGTISVSGSFPCGSKGISSLYYNVDTSNPLSTTTSTTSTTTSSSSYPNPANYSYNINTNITDMVIDYAYITGSNCAGSSIIFNAGSGRTGFNSTAEATCFPTSGHGMAYGNATATGTTTVSGSFTLLQQNATYNFYNAALALRRNSVPAVQTTGPVVSFSNAGCVVSSGACGDSSNILNLNQQYSAATGAVLNIQNAGTGADILLGSASTGQIQSAGGLTSNGINMQSGNATAGSSGAISVQSGTGTTGTGTLTVKTGNASAGASGALTVTTGTGTTASGALTISTGNASAGTAGNISIDTGTSSTGSGSISIGATNAGSVSLGKASGTLALNGVVNNAVKFKNTTDSTTAFQIQNSSATSLLTVDTTNSIVTIGSNSTGATAPWTSQASNLLPNARAGSGTTTYNGYIYLIGGDRSGTVLSTVMYAKVNSDGSTGAWKCQGQNTTSTAADYCGTAPTNSNTLPGARSDISAVAYGGYLYTFGGYDGTNKINNVYIAKINADGSTGAWSDKTSTYGTNFTAMSDIGVVAYNGYAYLIGGYPNAGSGMSDAYSVKLGPNGTLSNWNTYTGWIGSGLNKRDLGVVVANGYIYALAGDNGAGSPNIYYSKINADGSLPSASISASTALNLSQPGGAVYTMNGYIYVVGYYNSGANGRIVQFAKVNSDGSLGSWSCQGTSSGVCGGVTPVNSNWLPAERSYFGMTGLTINGYMYVIGGSNGNASNYSTTSIYYTSGQRLQVNGSLDLVGGDATSLSDSGTTAGSSGGSLTAGNTRIVGTLDVQGATNFAQDVVMSGNLNVAGAVDLASTLNVAGAVTFSTTLTVTGMATFNGGITVAGHVITTGTAPTTTNATGSGGDGFLGSTGSCALMSGNDTSGQIRLIVGGTGVNNGILCHITFNSAFASTPRVIISPVDRVSAGLDPFGGATSTTNFDVGAAAGMSNGTYYLNYFVVQ